MKCRFCTDQAVAVFDLPLGCVCLPCDRVQALCMQHIVRATPLGGIELREDLTVGCAFTAWWETKVVLVEGCLNVATNR